MALVCETMKYSSVIQMILDATGLQKREKTLKDTSLAKVLLYEFLFGKGFSQSGTLQV